MSTKKDKLNPKDLHFMSVALRLASARHGLTGTNPSVGCVITKNDKIISIGQTGFNGRPHAETNAIKNSFQNLSGSKMYVTLEPCNHYGKTPPCTKSIIKSGINELFYFGQIIFPPNLISIYSYTRIFCYYKSTRGVFYTLRMRATDY